jgi:hypothetical protein
MNLCLNCNGGTLIQGGLVDWQASDRSRAGACFHQFRAGNFGFAYSPKIEIEVVVHACLDCGFVIARAVLNKIQEYIAETTNVRMQDKNSSPTPDNVDMKRECPECHAKHLLAGGLQVQGPRGGWSEEPVFRPDNLRWLSFTPYGPGPKLDPGATVCCNCGLVWAHVNPKQLQEFVAHHCKKPK